MVYVMINCCMFIVLLILLILCVRYFMSQMEVCLLVFFLMILRPPRSTRTDTLFPYTTLFRSHASSPIRICGGSAVRSDNAPNKMILQRPGEILADRPAHDRFARAMHRLAVTADHIMLGGQRPPLGAQAIGAAWRQPFDIGELGFGTREAVGNLRSDGHTSKL